MQQQPPRPPLIAEIDQLRRSVDSMNSQTAEILKNMDTLRNIGAAHIAIPSTEQEKLDREWEYFETVCDQVFFILENTKYKLKRKQELLEQQLKPQPVLPPKVESSSTEMPSTPSTAAAGTTAGATLPTTSTISTPANATPASQAMTPVQVPAVHTTASPLSTSTPMSLVGDPSSVDAQMMSPPSLLGISSIGAAPAPIASSGAEVSTASLLSGSTLTANTIDSNSTFMMDESMMSEEDKLGDTMFDLGDIGNLGGNMDDMTNF
ncbi:hypothetical protein EMPS_10366 [Entomortierella parvispora]|uniref:Uncharacterized protein n=1 Tax=Entomortierella parvispora TaxID=205924 RepID=A0A9P3M194_9FUNG|nr:hypothetical protein EMPS_10366 [Entomortierella parvispora]